MSVMLLFISDSLTKFDGRHDTKAAAQRRYTVRRRMDPVRQAEYRAKRRAYMQNVWLPVGDTNIAFLN